MLKVSPNSRNVIPGEVWFTVDFRHPDDVTLSDMDAALRRSFREIADAADLNLEIEQIWHFPATPFEKSCIEAVRRGAVAGEYTHMEIVSGAGHDAVYLAQVAPTGMIFVPCENGISHNEIENALPEDLTAGCNVLLHAMLAQAHLSIEESRGE